jgi:hypothetical protein
MIGSKMRFNVRLFRDGCLVEVGRHYPADILNNVDEDFVLEGLDGGSAMAIAEAHVGFKPVLLPDGSGRYHCECEFPSVAAILWPVAGSASN